MISKDVYSLFSSSISEYLDELVEIFQGGELPMQSYPLLSKALNHAILDMKGALEQKCYTLALYVISMNGKMKYDAFHGKILQVSKLEAFFGDIIGIIREIADDKSEYNLWEDITAFSTSIKTIKDKFSNKYILSYIGQEYEEFVEKTANTDVKYYNHVFEKSCNDLKSIESRLKSLDNPPVEYIDARKKAIAKLKEAKEELTIARSNRKEISLSNLYDACVGNRNNIAHNTKSALLFSDTFKQFNNKSHSNNIFFIFMVLLYVENVFRGVFNKLQQSLNKQFI